MNVGRSGADERLATQRESFMVNTMSLHEFG